MLKSSAGHCDCVHFGNAEQPAGRRDAGTSTRAGQAVLSRLQASAGRRAGPAFLEEEEEGAAVRWNDGPSWQGAPPPGRRNARLVGGPCYKVGANGSGDQQARVQEGTERAQSTMHRAVKQPSTKHKACSVLACQRKQQTMLQRYGHVSWARGQVSRQNGKSSRRQQAAQQSIGTYRLFAGLLPLCWKGLRRTA